MALDLEITLLLKEDDYDVADVATVLKLAEYSWNENEYKNAIIVNSVLDFGSFEIM